MRDYLSILDSKRFGFKIAKLPSDINHIEDIINDLKKVDIRLAIIRVHQDNTELINRLEDVGFRIKDSQVVFNRTLLNNIILPLRNEIEYISYDDKILKRLIDITKNSFYNYGHYFADVKLNKEKCLEIYCDWIKNCCKDKKFADTVLIAKIDNSIAGYLALKIHHKNKMSYVAGVIGAVAPEWRGEGIFKEINIKSIYWAKENSGFRIENNVLTTNLSVIKTYIGLDYYIIKSEITMHLWV